jgi:hypothetical protein
MREHPYALGFAPRRFSAASCYYAKNSFLDVGALGTDLARDTRARLAMVETRIAPRYRVSKPAQIEYGGDKTPCTIRDLSATGAAIELVDPSATVPAAFTLIVPDDKLKLPCRVVWRRTFKIGVTFD